MFHLQHLTVSSHCIQSMVNSHRAIYFDKLPIRVKQKSTERTDISIFVSKGSESVLLRLFFWSLWCSVVKFKEALIFIILMQNKLNIDLKKNC